MLCTLFFAIILILQIVPDASASSAHIVVFKHDTSESHRARHVATWRHLIKDTFDIGGFHGYVATLDDSTVAHIRATQEVRFTEADVTMYGFQNSTNCTKETPANWGIDRIDHQNFNLDNAYIYNTTGSGVNIYVVDSGIYLGHQEFQGRAIFGANFVDNNDDDCNGHGTHVAGIAGGVTYGVAKQTTLIAVKVLNCSNAGSVAGIIKGIQWATSDAASRKGRSIVNLSLGGPKSDSLNMAVEAAVSAGLVFTAAAGNDNADSCGYSPASEPLAITVGSTFYDPSITFDQRSSFSNWGTCLDYWAPGTRIVSAWIGSPSATRSQSGTSMSSPFAAGMAARYLQDHPNAPPSEVKGALIAASTKNIIDLNCGSTTGCSDSPNRMAYVASGC